MSSQAETREGEAQATPLSPGLEALSEAIGQAAAEAPPPTMLGGELAQDPQLIADFLMEGREHLANVEQHVLTLEQDPANAEAVHAAFRSFHTIKGLAGFLEFQTVRDVAHEVETVLDLVRNQQFTMTAELTDAMLAATDHLGTWFRYIERQGKGDAPSDHTALLDRLKSISAGESGAAGPGAGVVVAAAAEVVEVVEVETPAEVHAEHVEESAPVAATKSASRTQAAAVKVDTAKLDALMDMVGELVISQSLVRHDPDLEALRTPRLQRNLSQLARVTVEVQKTAMAMRMVPVGQLFGRMGRLVRDLARRFGKQIELELVGEEVELDRNLVEELSDPLVHMLRNAVDHGLEPPEERVAAGKPAAGRVRLQASHQAGHIAIEIADDGRGLNRARIVDKAIARGLIHDTAGMSDSEIFQLIFHAGFSTAEQVTDLSGRGVGMDVVRKKVEKLRGRIEIESAAGRGTRFVMKLPLTLAIIDGLVVLVGEERYIVPIFAVREMFRPTPEQLFTVVDQGEMALVRGNLLPVVRLARKMGARARSENPCDGLLIVGEAEGRLYCLQVDELLGKQEVVIKSLGETFRHVVGVAGGAILGDGRVGLILDMASLAGGRGHAR